MAVKVAVTTPITTLGNQTDTPRNAMLMPTAKASMLVATESVTSRRPRVGSLLFSGSSRSAGLPEHLAAHVAQQRECQPAVVSVDVGGQALAGQPADDRHHELEQPEVKAQPEDVTRRHRVDGQTGGDGNRQGVHRQTDGESQ